MTIEFLKFKYMTNIAYILISSEDYVNKIKHITPKKIEIIHLPEVLSPLHQEFKSWNDRLSQLYPKFMLHL